MSIGDDYLIWDWGETEIERGRGIGPWGGSGKKTVGGPRTYLLPVHAWTTQPFRVSPCRTPRTRTPDVRTSSNGPLGVGRTASLRPRRPECSRLGVPRGGLGATGDPRRNGVWGWAEIGVWPLSGGTTSGGGGEGRETSVSHSPGEYLQESPMDAIWPRHPGRELSPERNGFGCHPLSTTKVFTRDSGNHAYLGFSACFRAMRLNNCELLPKMQMLDDPRHLHSGGNFGSSLRAPIGWVVPTDWVLFSCSLGGCHRPCLFTFQANSRIRLRPPLTGIVP
jgi:hypothetical protein